VSAPASTPTLAAADARRIAEAFLPRVPLGNRYDFYYVRTKLRTDPLYPGAIDALRDSSAPLLDLGCGLGLLAHALHGAGIALPYRGVDNDAAKIARAQRAADRRGFPARFEVVDLARGLPEHRGSVAILDVLQYLDAPVRDDLLVRTAAMLDDGARLVVRTPIEDRSRRMRITRWTDRFAHGVGWMGARARSYPTLDGLRSVLEAAGLRVETRPLHGNTPFNNWLIVARR
jgi:cyclopropane fatty-acyl-phospholipid synthase-like methyltransferase